MLQHVGHMSSRSQAHSRDQGQHQLTGLVHEHKVHLEVMEESLAGDLKALFSSTEQPLGQTEKHVFPSSTYIPSSDMNGGQETYASLSTSFFPFSHDDAPGVAMFFFSDRLLQAKLSIISCVYLEKLKTDTIK